MALRRVALFSLLGSAVAWGPDGHTIVAHIAEQLLTPDVNATLFDILGGDTLSHASDWNDDYDHSPEGKWSESLHFINYPGHACAFDWARDCKDDQCNVGTIVNYTRQVADTTLSTADRLFALKFVIHMMGDVHQPLHVASWLDRGGNEIELAGNQFSPEPEHWVNRSSTLHAAWDGSLLVQDIFDIEYPPNRRLSGKKPFPVYYHKWELLAGKIEKLIGEGGDWHSKVSEWQQPVSTPKSEQQFRTGLAVVANGTAEQGCEYAYNFQGKAVKSGDVLPRSYYLRAKPIIEEQLAKGGVRLAQVLNLALAKTTKPITVLV